MTSTERDQTMINEKDQILTFLRQHKADFQRQFGIEKIGLFGSAVRGELTGNSDIDIAIEIQSHKKNLHNFLAFKRLLEAEFQRPVDLGIESTLKPAIRQALAREIFYV